MTISKERMDELIDKTLPVLNRFETHLGCAKCRGPLTDGRCAVCQGEGKP